MKNCLNTASAVTFVVTAEEKAELFGSSQYRLSSNLCGPNYIYELLIFYYCLNTASAVTFVVW